MDYESLLFCLKPLIESEKLDKYLLPRSVFDRLDDLAVSLRSEINRETVGQSGLLLDLIKLLNTSLFYFFTENDTDFIWLKLASSLIRCIANCVADNDENRNIFIMTDKSFEHSILKKYLPLIFSFRDQNNIELCLALHKHSAAFVKNLFMDNEEYMELFGPHFQKPLIPLISELFNADNLDLQTLDMISELLSDFAEVGNQGTLTDLSMIATGIEKSTQMLIGLKDSKSASSTDEYDDEEDLYVGIILNMTKCLEVMTKKNSDSWDSSSYIHIHEIEEILFACLSNLYPLPFSNKLIVLRRITVPFGYFTTLKGYSNVNEQNLCIDMLSKFKDNGYITSCAMVVLSNSIASRKDVDHINNLVSMKHLIELGTYFDDPVQYQGYLDILKKLLNLSSVILIDKSDLLTFCNVIQACYDKTQYFKQLLPLLSSLIQKLLVVLPSSSLYFLLADEKSVLLQIILQNDCVFSCLALDKLLVSGKIPSLPVFHFLWKSAFSLRADLNKDDNIPPFRLFQLAKSIGIYLKNCETQNVPFNENVMFHEYATNVISFLDDILNLVSEDQKAMKAAINNAQFVAGMINNLLQLQEMSGDIVIMRDKCLQLLDPELPKQIED